MIPISTQVGGGADRRRIPQHAEDQHRGHHHFRLSGHSAGTGGGAAPELGGGLCHVGVRHSAQRHPRLPGGGGAGAVFRREAGVVPGVGRGLVAAFHPAGHCRRHRARFPECPYDPLPPCWRSSARTMSGPPGPRALPREGHHPPCAEKRAYPHHHHGGQRTGAAMAGSILVGDDLQYSRYGHADQPVHQQQADFITVQGLRAHLRGGGGADESADRSGLRGGGSPDQGPVYRRQPDREKEGQGREGGGLI